MNRVLIAIAFGTLVGGCSLTAPQSSAPSDEQCVTIEDVEQKIRVGMTMEDVDRLFVGSDSMVIISEISIFTYEVSNGTIAVHYGFDNSNVLRVVSWSSKKTK